MALRRNTEGASRINSLPVPFKPLALLQANGELRKMGNTALPKRCS